MCPNCGCETSVKTYDWTSVDLGNRRMLIIRQVPFDKCTNCKDRYLRDEVKERIDKIAATVEVKEGMAEIVHYREVKV